VGQTLLSHPQTVPKAQHLQPAQPAQMPDACSHVTHESATSHMSQHSLSSQIIRRELCEKTCVLLQSSLVRRSDIREGSGNGYRRQVVASTFF
jgi:hypothetical protein